MITSEWGVPSQFETGLNFDDLINGRYGRNLHFWDLRNAQEHTDHQPGRGIPAGVRAAPGP
jgi:hypothetical protein